MGSVNEVSASAVHDVQEIATEENAEELSPVPTEIGEQRPPVPTPSKSGSLKAMFYSLTGRAGLLVLDSATGIVCARLLRPEGRGELSAMILWPVFLSQAFTLGIPSAIVYTLRKSRDQVGSLIAAAIVLGAGMSAFTAILGVLLLPAWLHHYSPQLVRQSQWFMLAAPSSMAALIFRAVWEGSDGFGKSAGSSLLSRIGTLTGLAIFISLHRLTPLTAALCYVLSGVPPFLWACAAIVPHARWAWGQVKTGARTLLSYGLRSYGIDLCGALAQYVDQALVLGMLTASQMGSYTVALSLSRMLNVISVSMAAVLFPKAVGSTPERAIRLAVRTVIGSFSLGILGAMFILFAGAFMLNLLYGHEYLVATGMLKILTVEALLSGSLTVMSQPFMALGRPGTVTLLQVGGLLTSIPMITFLVPRYGPEGATVALVCSAVVRGILLAISYHRTFPGSFRFSMIGEEAAVLVESLKKRLQKQSAQASA